MKYELWRDQERLGAYSEAELREGLATGRILTTDRYRTRYFAMLVPVARLALGLSDSAHIPLRSRAWSMVGLGCALAVFAGISVLVSRTAYPWLVPWLKFVVTLASLLLLGIALAELRSLRPPKRKTAGLMMLIMGFIGVGYTMILPKISRIENPGPITRSINHARQVVTTCRLYASDHQCAFPPDLPTLISSGTATDLKIFIDPLDKTKAPYGYVYLGAGVKDTDPGSTMILHNRVPDAKGRYVVGYVDGSVKLEPLPRP